MSQFYKPRIFQVEARQFDLAAAGEMKEFEEWSGGSVKGTALAPSERVLVVWSSGIEHVANVGDWVLKTIHGETIVRSDHDFQRDYEESE